MTYYFLYARPSYIFYIIDSILFYLLIDKIIFVLYIVSTIILGEVNIMNMDKPVTLEAAKKAGRPKLTEEQRAEREKKKEMKSGETRDSVRIYFTPLQYAYLKDYHAQGGVLPGEAIRLAVDFYFEYLIKTERYEPTVTPKSARQAWEERQRRPGNMEDVGEDK